MTQNLTVEEAREALARAEAERAEDARKQAAERDENARKAWQAQLDAYDPKAARAAVTEAAERLTEAARSGALAPLTDYLAAMIDEARQASEAVDAQANGADANGRKLQSMERLTDATGRKFALLDEVPALILMYAVLGAANEAADARTAERRTAREKITGPAPTLTPEETEARRIEARHTLRQDRRRAELAARRAEH